MLKGLSEAIVELFSNECFTWNILVAPIFMQARMRCVSYYFFAYNLKELRLKKLLLKKCTRSDSGTTVKKHLSRNFRTDVERVFHVKHSTNLGNIRAHPTAFEKIRQHPKHLKTPKGSKRLKAPNNIRNIQRLSIMFDNFQEHPMTFKTFIPLSFAL